MNSTIFRPNTRVSGRWCDPERKTIAIVMPHKDNKTTVILFEADGRVSEASAPTVREAYHEALRQFRLARYDTADLRRQVATLQRQLEGHAALSHFRRDIRRRARHAAAIRAHRAALQTQRQQHDESLRACRRALIERTTERNAVASRITRLQAAITEARSKSTELDGALGRLTTDQIEEIVSRLLELAARSAEYHRRATAAEARAEQTMAGQRSLIAAAQAAGFHYTVTSEGTVKFVCSTT
mgnify:FL=1